jgi:multidrug efflux pump subunit AcrA (membrane-fusion protein)
MLPGSSVLRSEGSTSLFIVDLNARKVVKRLVKLATDPAPGNAVVVAEGVKSGERVVIAGVNKLQDGQSIRIDQEVSQ